MTQEDLARRMHSVVYAQRKLAYLQEKLQELQAHDPIVLLPDQRSLSAVDVEVAAQYEQQLHEATAQIAQEAGAKRGASSEAQGAGKGVAHRVRNILYFFHFTTLASVACFGAGQVFKA